jgi:hypothetical protein
MKNVTAIRFRTVADLRKFHGLTVVELAAIVNRTPATVESWESVASGRKCPIPLNEVDALIKVRLSEGLLPPNNNLLFSTMPLSIAPALLQVSTSQFLKDIGLNASVWKKYCSSRQDLPIDLKERIETAVNKAMNCALPRNQNNGRILQFRKQVNL